MINVLEQPKRSKLRQPRPTDANQLYVNVENMEVDYGDEVGTQMLSKTVLLQGRHLSKASASNEDF